MGPMETADSFARLLAPFARVPGSNDMSEDRETWKRRREITALLLRIQQSAAEAECALDWKRLAPERTEQEARPHLNELEELVAQLFDKPAEA